MSQSWEASPKPAMQTDGNQLESCSPSLACAYACNWQTERTGGRQGKLPSVRSVPSPNSLTNALPNGQANGLNPERSGVQSGVRSDAHSVKRSEFGRVLCKKGFSIAQINIIGLLLGIGPQVVSYKELASELEYYYGLKRTSEAVRQIVLRLASRGILRHTKAREGMLQGVRFQLVYELICPHIRPPECPDGRSGEQSGERTDIRSGHFSPVSILEEIDRKNLSISLGKTKESRLLLEALSEEHISFHWPELARCDFGTAQIRQIIERRDQVGEGVENIMQGLNFAEWELANDCMRDAQGNGIESPRNWVFRILATQGYYPRPANYVSPVEQAERDREEIAKREQHAIQARRNAEADIWLANLTQSEKDAILKTTGGIQGAVHDQTRLRLHFQNKVWPALREYSSKI